MGLKGKSKLDELEVPKFDMPPVIPDDEEELDRQIREMSDEDPVAESLFKNAEQYAELTATSCNAGHKLACLRLVRNELADTRRLLWWALFEMKKSREALEAATASSDNIVSGICDNIVKAQQTPMPVKLAPGEEEQLRQHRKELITQEKEAMSGHKTDLHEELQKHYWKLNGLKWSNEDGLAIHGKWVKWAVGFFIFGILCAAGMLVFCGVIIVNWLAG